MFPFTENGAPKLKHALFSGGVFHSHPGNRKPHPLEGHGDRNVARQFTHPTNSGQVEYIGGAPTTAHFDRLKARALNEGENPA